MFGYFVQFEMHKFLLPSHNPVSIAKGKVKVNVNPVSIVYKMKVKYNVNLCLLRL